MTISWQPEAEAALTRIVHRLNELSPGAGSRVGRRIRARVAHLDVFPDSGRVVPEYQDVFLREVLVGVYRVIYLVQGEDVHIVTMFHGAMDLASED